MEFTDIFVKSWDSTIDSSFPQTTSDSMSSQLYFCYSNNKNNKIQVPSLVPASSRQTWLCLQHTIQLVLSTGPAHAHSQHHRLCEDCRYHISIAIEQFKSCCMLSKTIKLLPSHASTVISSYSSKQLFSKAFLQTHLQTFATYTRFKPQLLLRTHWLCLSLFLLCF